MNLKGLLSVSALLFLMVGAIYGETEVNSKKPKNAVVEQVVVQPETPVV